METAVMVKEPKAAWDAYMKKYDYLPPESLFDWPMFSKLWIAEQSLATQPQTYLVPVEFRSRAFRGVFKASIQTLSIEATNPLQAALLARDEAASRLGMRCFPGCKGDFIIISVTVLQIEA